MTVPSALKADTQACINRHCCRSEVFDDQLHADNGLAALSTRQAINCGKSMVTSNNPRGICHKALADIRLLPGLVRIEQTGCSAYVWQYLYMLLIPKL